MKRLLSGITIEKHRITAAPSEHISHLIKEPIFIESKQVDLSKTPLDIACLPFVYNLAPIAWRLGGGWVVDELSQVAAKNLEEVRSNMAELWPDYEWTGTMHGLSEASRNNGNKPALLFSGGLDSTFTAMQILARKPTLVTIHGGRDLQLQDDNAWLAVENATAKFALQHNLETLQIKSNFTLALSEEVDKLCPGLPASWWASIQHGLGLSGVSAPVIFANGNEELFISATHTTGHQSGWGSHPKLDGILNWSAGKVNHFGYDHDRTLKIRALKELSNTNKVPVPELIVCTRRNRQGNCMRCPKCLRTMGSVLVNEYDPQEFGFGVSKREAQSHLMSSVPSGIKITDNEVYAWRSISTHAKEHMDQKADKFMRWLAKLDLARKPGFFERLVNGK